MPPNEDPVKLKQAAQLKVMDLMSVRTHTEKELRHKLSAHFADETDLESLVEHAIDFAKEKKYLEDPQALAERWAETLHRRQKGIEFINGYLEEKGLPSIAMNSELELEKALSLIKTKYAENYEFSEEEKARVGRMLSSRGFDSETVRKVIYEKL